MDNRVTSLRLDDPAVRAKLHQHRRAHFEDTPPLDNTPPSRSTPSPRSAEIARLTQQLASAELEIATLKRQIEKLSAAVSPNPIANPENTDSVEAKCEDQVDPGSPLGPSRSTQIRALREKLAAGRLAVDTDADDRPRLRGPSRTLSRNLSARSSRAPSRDPVASRALSRSSSCYGSPGRARRQPQGWVSWVTSPGEVLSWALFD